MATRREFFYSRAAASVYTRAVAFIFVDDCHQRYQMTQLEKKSVIIKKNK